MEFKQVLFGLILLLHAPFSPSHSQDKESRELFVVIVNGKRGYIDISGNIKIKPQFEGANSFAEGLAVIETSEYGYKEGYIDKTGRIVIPPRYDKATDFSEGLAAVGFGEFGLHGSGDHKWGFIDKTGQLIIKADYREARGFSEGLALVQNDDGKWGYINKAGEILIPCTYTYATGFSEGLACVAIGNKYGYIDRKGKIVISPQFSSAGGFQEELALARIGGKTRRPYDWIVGPLGGRIVYIDQTGKIRIKLQNNVENAHPFSEGLAAIEVRKRDGSISCGYMDKIGKMIIEQRFGFCEEFSEGMALIHVNGRWGYIDKTGTIVLKTNFTLAKSFRNGLATVQVGGLTSDDLQNAKYGYIDKIGKLVWEPSR
jgi:hypothetical protein